MKFKEKLIMCVRCPTAYHHNHCMTACTHNKGTLNCCEICPAAFHLECVNLSEPPEEYYCDHCETGRMPLYSEIDRSQDGEFPVQFLGSQDYACINQVRAFSTTREKVPALSSRTMDAYFRHGLKEAEELFESYNKQKSDRVLKYSAKRYFGNKPSNYV